MQNVIKKIIEIIVEGIDKYPLLKFGACLVAIYLIYLAGKAAGEAICYLTHEV